MVWTGSSYGNFSLKSVIAIIRKEAENERDSFWDLVWQINLPHKINFFLWLVAQECLMANANRFARGLAQSLACTICDATEETTLHLLRDYLLARSVWRSLVSHPEQATFFTKPLRNWLSSNLTISTTDHGHWPTQFATTLWWIWRWRNKHILDEPLFTPSNPRNFIQV